MSSLPIICSYSALVTSDLFHNQDSSLGLHHLFSKSFSVILKIITDTHTHRERRVQPSLCIKHQSIGDNSAHHGILFSREVDRLGKQEYFQEVYSFVNLVMKICESWEFKPILGGRSIQIPRQTSGAMCTQ